MKKHIVAPVVRVIHFDGGVICSASPRVNNCIGNEQLAPIRIGGIFYTDDDKQQSSIW